MAEVSGYTHTNTHLHIYAYKHPHPYTRSRTHKYAQTHTHIPAEGRNKLAKVNQYIHAAHKRTHSLSQTRNVKQAI